MSERARVLAVAQASVLGGAEYGLLRVARRLPAHGLEVEITTPGPGPLEDAAEEAGIATHRLAVGGLTTGSWTKALTSLPRARALAKDGGYDLAWLNGTVAQRLSPGLAGVTLVPHVHDLLERAPLPWRTRRFWARAPIALCDSQAVADRATALGAPAGALRVVGCPVDPPEAAARPEWADGRPTVGFVGRIEPRKGPLDLLQALPWLAERVPGVRIALVGEAEMDAPRDYADRVRSEAARHGEDVLLLGAVPEAARLMPWFDVVAVPSRSEPFGTVAAEALAAGTPVVATTSGGMQEYIKDGEVGALVAPADPAALADALGRVLPGAPGMADACRQAAAPFLTDRVSASIAHALREALAG